MINIMAIMEGEANSLPVLSDICTKDRRSRAVKRALGNYLACTRRKHRCASSLAYLTGNRIINWEYPCGYLQPSMVWFFDESMDKTLRYTRDFDKAVHYFFDTFGGRILRHQKQEKLRDDDCNEFIRQAVYKLYEELGD